MLDWGRRFHRWSKRSFLIFAVGLTALEILVKKVLLPGYLWLKETMPALMYHGAAIENSEPFMSSLLFFYIASLGFVAYLFIKTWKRPAEAPAHR